MIRKPKYSSEHKSWFIPLTRGVIALVDADMAPILAKHNWRANKQPRQWVAIRSGPRRGGNQSTELMHRVITKAAAGMEVDHLNHYPVHLKVIDNRQSNLRTCTRSENQRNQRPQRGGSSPFKGVSLHKATNKWLAHIKIDGKLKHLGYFTNDIEAARAYDTAAREHFGPFRKTNKSLGLLSETITEVKDDE